jgi:hypothetical protein
MRDKLPITKCLPSRAIRRCASALGLTAIVFSFAFVGRQARAQSDPLSMLKSNTSTTGRQLLQSLRSGTYRSEANFPAR